MCSYAKEQIELSTALSDGSAKRDHLAVVARVTGKQLASDASSECPPELLYLWEDFAKLRGKRRSDGMGGVSPIGYADMRDYCQAHKLPEFAAWEVDALDKLDGVWRSVRTETVKRQEEMAKAKSNV